MEETSHLANFFESFMIRHTKSQRINGELALCLPDSRTTVKPLKMSEKERKAYRKAYNYQGILFARQNRSRDVQTSRMEMMWYGRMMNQVARYDSTKVQALISDLKELLDKEPNMRAVVFTNFLDLQWFANHAIKHTLNIQTYVLNGAKSATDRDRSIREFQNVSDEGGPAVFLMTVKSGSVGVNLTAASHVFLLEPCLDSSTEVQAAGRIHRLGQTKPVGVTKYFFEDCPCEAQVVKLHEKLRNGHLTYRTGFLSYQAVNILLDGNAAWEVPSDEELSDDESHGAEDDGGKNGDIPEAPWF
jgi:SNF2 family DNA or RNA helicase